MIKKDIFWVFEISIWFRFGFGMQQDHTYGNCEYFDIIAK